MTIEQKKNVRPPIPRQIMSDTDRGLLQKRPVVGYQPREKNRAK
jgi:hypothetical protein